jgi:hypothetical protein
MMQIASRVYVLDAHLKGAVPRPNGEDFHIGLTIPFGLVMVGWDDYGRNTPSAAMASTRTVLTQTASIVWS